PDGGPGRLLRFLNDQQCCLPWYLHLLPDGRHTVVCAWPEFDDGADGSSLEAIATPRDPVICAPSFEDFVYRFLLENTLWFAVEEGRTLSDEERAYIDSARHNLEEIDRQQGEL